MFRNGHKTVRYAGRPDKDLRGSTSFRLLHRYAGYYRNDPYREPGKALALDPETAEKVILGFKGDYDQIPHVFRLKGGREKALRPGPCRKGSGAEGQKSTDSGDFHLKYGASQSIHPGYLLQRHLHTDLVRRYRKRTGHRGCMEHLLRTRVDRF